jgi:hypothetical protein
MQLNLPIVSVQESEYVNRRYGLSDLERFELPAVTSRVVLSAELYWASL